MTAALHLRPGDHLLEIGDDATLAGMPEHGPYDAIVVLRWASELPATLLDQLSIRGRLVMALGDLRRRRLIRVRKLGPGQFAFDDLGTLPG